MALRRPALLALVLVAALSLMGSSCKDKRETRKVQEISSSLCEAANDFNRLIVWQNYRAASLMVVPSKRIDFLVEVFRLDRDFQFVAQTFAFDFFNLHNS